MEERHLEPSSFPSQRLCARFHDRLRLWVWALYLGAKLHLGSHANCSGACTFIASSNGWFFPLGQLGGAVALLAMEERVLV